jgi:hypothetical protein
LFDEYRLPQFWARFKARLQYRPRRVAPHLWTPVLSASGGRRPNPDIRARGLLRKLPFMAMRLPGNEGITACDGSLPLGEQYLNLTEQEIDIHWLRQYPVCN